MTTKLTEHFTLEEMTYTTVRLPNDPLPAARENLKALCENILEKIRAQFGAIRVHSGFRSDAVNTRVGGAADSQHRKGEAADIDALAGGINHYTLAKWIAANTDFDQLILEFVDEAGEAGWIHVSYVTRRPNRHSIKIAQRVMDDTKRWRTRYQTITADQIPTAKEAA